MLIQVLTSDSFHDFIKQNRLAIVDFWASWCKPCQQLMPTIQAVAKEYEGKIAICKIDIDNFLPFARSQDVRTIPTLILFADGKEVKRITGIIAKENLEIILNATLEQYYDHS